MNYADLVRYGELTQSTSTFTQCEHKRGWYYKLKIWPFSYKVFVCEECMEILDDKRKRILK